MVAPRPAYQTLRGYLHLCHKCTIPSTSVSQCNSFNTITSGSIGLSNLSLGSNDSEPNTPTAQQSDAQGP